MASVGKAFNVQTGGSAHVTTSTTLFTTPSDGFAILSARSGAANTMNIGTATFPMTANSDVTYHVGPSQTVIANISSSSTDASWVIFENT